MAPTLVREPFHRDGWVYEEKNGRRQAPAVEGRSMFSPLVYGGVVEMTIVSVRLAMPESCAAV